MPPRPLSNSAASLLLLGRSARRHVHPEVVREVKAKLEKEMDGDGKLPKGARRKVYTDVAQKHGTKRRVVRKLSRLPRFVQALGSGHPWMSRKGLGCVKTHFARRVGSLTDEFDVISRLKLHLRG